MSPRRPDYTSFLLRLWRERSRRLAPQAVGRPWLAQIEHTLGGEKEYSASLDDLSAFTRAQLPTPSQEPNPGQ